MRLIFVKEANDNTTPEACAKITGEKFKGENALSHNPISWNGKNLRFFNSPR